MNRVENRGSSKVYQTRTRRHLRCVYYQTTLHISNSHEKNAFSFVVRSAISQKDNIQTNRELFIETKKQPEVNSTEPLRHSTQLLTHLGLENCTCHRNCGVKNSKTFTKTHSFQQERLEKQYHQDVELRALPRSSLFIISDSLELLIQQLIYFSQNISFESTRLYKSKKCDGS